MECQLNTFEPAYHNFEIGLLITVYPTCGEIYYVEFIVYFIKLTSFNIRVMQLSLLGEICFAW